MFSSYVFFIFCFFFIIMIWGLRFTKFKNYKLIFLIASLMALFFWTSEVDRTKVFLFLSYNLSLIWLAHRLPQKFRLPLIVLTILPLFVFKIGYQWFWITGISYITFRMIQILIDLEKNAQTCWQAIIIYLINPLTLIAGPIDHFKRLDENLTSFKKHLTIINLKKGWYYFLLGVLHKFVLAFFWEKLISNFFSANSLQLKDIIGTAYSYTPYLYFDFAGYSFMALGLGYMMGIEIPLNFNKPWLSKNPQDFWKRFHITLGSFLNKYFFTPIYLHLSRIHFFGKHKLLTQNLSLIFTFLLMGIWNGLRWNYLVSGLIFGLCSVVYNSYRQLKLKESFFITALGRFTFLNVVVWALYLFSGKLPL